MSVGDDTGDRLNRIEAARAALADARAADPDGVTRYEVRTARIDQARKRERDRFDRRVIGEGDPRPSPPSAKRPTGMSKQLWKAEADRLKRVYAADLYAWRRRERRRAENAPPAEQMEKTPFLEADVNELVAGKPIKIGRAYCRQPRFETFDWLTVPQVAALRRYRRAFDVSELSPVKSGLDIGAGGGSGGSEAAISRVQALAFADIAVQRIEAAIPAGLLRTLRAVALFDADFKAVAIERFGSASGQRRTRVRHDFERAVAALMLTQTPPVTAAVEASGERAVEGIATITAVVNAAFLDERGYLRPMSDIAAIILGHDADRSEDAA